MISLVWIGFVVLVLGLLALDLGVFHRKEQVVSIKEALSWSALWISLALAFNVFIYFFYGNHWLGFSATSSHGLTGGQAALQFFTGYVVEKSLSVDNIFVIAMIFSYFGVPLIRQHRVLYWGILGALVMRGGMIAMGAALMARFSWMIYIFGALLLLTAVKLLVTRHDNLTPDRNIFVRLIRKVFPVTDDFHGNHFFVRVAGRLAVTPLFIALVIVETSDVLFALDSIPAIFAITQDPFLVFTSNVFAILGLRSLYFALAGVIQHFRYLKTSLVFLLAFIGTKMILSHHHPIPTLVSLAMIMGILAVGVLASIFASDRDTAKLISPLADEIDGLKRVGIRQARKVVVLITGSTVLLVGIAMIVLPGPAFLVVPAGLAILSFEFYWARRWLVKVQRITRRMQESVGLGRGEKAPPVISEQGRPNLPE